MDSKKPYLVSIIIRCIYAGMSLLSKAAYNHGMSTYVFLFYRQCVAFIFLAPFALIFESKTAPPLRFKTFLKMFLLALIGITFSINMYGLGISYTSATLASAITNTVPVITFFLSTLLRMETVKLKRASGIAKLAGVALCMAGALTIAFYRGPSLKSFNHHYISSHHNNNRPATNAKETWMEGTFLMLLCTISWSIWLVFQGRVMEEYPSKLLFATILCICGALQTFVVALVFERDYSRWMLGFDIDLFAVAYCGIFVSGLVLYLQNWCIEKRGPVFYAMSSPLTFVITIIGSSFALGERINLGSVLGGTSMVGGLYSVLWGKSKDQKEKETMAASPLESL